MPRDLRIACVSVAALPLQLVLRAHPEWRADPLVVVEDDRPLAEILWANSAALKLRVARGMRFNQARAIVSRLRAAVVSRDEIDAAVEEILKLLVRFSPRVEPARAWPGVFWIDANGLTRLFRSLHAWAGLVREAVAAAGLSASVVVGFQRYGAFAVARTRAGAIVLGDAEEERRLAGEAELARIGAASKLVSQMAVLGVRTLGEFLRLPAAGLSARYGEEALSLHELSSGARVEPLEARAPVENVRVDFDVDPPESDRARLVALFDDALQGMVVELARRSEAITALVLTLELERSRMKFLARTESASRFRANAHGGQERAQPDSRLRANARNEPSREDERLAPYNGNDPADVGGRVRSERIATAAPTLDLAQIKELVDLRLSSLVLEAPVERASVELESVRVRPEQIELLKGTSRRDLRAASRALARIQAAFGAGSVVRARLLPRHLPEASFRYEPAIDARLPVPRVMPRELPLVRQLYAAPVPLPPIPAHEPEAWLGTHGAVVAMRGPFRTSGGWWKKRVERDYFYVETQKGEILWLFYDRPRRRWFLHGVVD